MKQDILAKIAEIEAMLEEATCDGLQLAELDCFDEVSAAVNTLAETVVYYVD
jgi:hypothetical protein